MLLRIFGKNPSGERLKRIQASPQYRDGAFQNLSKTKMMAEDVSAFKMMKDFTDKSKDGTPAKPLPAVRTDLKNLPGDKTSVVWFGHSSYLIKVDGKVIVVDPVLSGSAAPFSFMVKAFKGTDIYTAADFPEIDALLITHDHYDHLDYNFLMTLKNKVRAVVCSLGVGSHLEYWGFDKKNIHELDWWEETSLDALNFTAAPARHFSGRGIRRNQTLWSSFVLRTKAHRLYLGGDSGYDTHFKKIGDEFGPFDLAILECGQYNRSWPKIHMMPEETVDAAIELKAKILLPVHWGKFMLAWHSWREPAERVTRSAKEKNIKVATPVIGEHFILEGKVPDQKWWEQF